MTDREREILCCVGVTESLTQRLQNLPPGKFNACELRDIYRTLRDLEDRLWGQGEYAPENVAPTGKPSFSRGK